VGEARNIPSASTTSAKAKSEAKIYICLIIISASFLIKKPNLLDSRKLSFIARNLRSPAQNKKVLGRKVIVTFKTKDFNVLNDIANITYGVVLVKIIFLESRLL
jgi:hypothetical protein